MDQGYTKGQSDNIPLVTNEMVLNFYHDNADYVSSEMQNVKTAKSARESYGDNAIGYVQVMRKENVCHLKCKITPEHKVHKKAYNLTMIVDEEDQIIKSITCDGCTASKGGCKHAVAFSFWAARRACEPSTTEVKCYWKKSALSGVGMSKDGIKLSEAGGGSIPDLPIERGAIFKKFLNEASNKVPLPRIQVFKYFKDDNSIENLYIHNLIENFKVNENDNQKTVESFLNFCEKFLTVCACSGVEKATRDQSNSAVWHNIRYARITASKAYEAAHCKTLEGTLVEQIMGGKTIKTKAMERGILLEPQILEALAKKTGEKFTKCGIYLSKAHPVLGASPDGINQNYTVEIKCPSSQESYSKYFRDDGQPNAKHMAQLQLQMYMTNKKKSFFCVASPDFEETQQFRHCVVKYNEEYVNDLLAKCEDFWKKAIFSLLMND